MVAVPWTAFCINYQEQIDRHEIEFDENKNMDRIASAA